jgi:uncharacterized membrane protein YebE (DUF533 family)
MKESKIAMYVVAILGIGIVGYMVYKNIKDGKEKGGEKEEKTIIDGEKKYTMAEWRKANEVSAALKGIKLA